ncbi:MAG: hypothetical protein Kow0062_06340 [Acidobacteriota bacterium]|nr:MAG: hypothetical protein D6738_09555 [Acidobacteriota bacterium]
MTALLRRAPGSALVLALAAIVAPALGQQAPEHPAPTAQQSLLAGPLSAEMVIGAQDLLEIRVFGMPELTMEKRVDPDGTISLPLIGTVGVGGLTSKQAEDLIATLLRAKELVIDPQVTVVIKEYVSRRVSVIGAVSKPGMYEMLGQRTLLDMIGEAGGLNDRAGNRIFVVRRNSAGEDVRIEIDAEALVYSGDPRENMVLRPGDIVMVPYRRMIRIYVNGAVAQPGAIDFPADEEITVLQAVTAAGGSTDRANERDVQVIRRYPDGTRRVFEVNLKRIKRGRADDMVLEPNDIVVVPESFF